MEMTLASSTVAGTTKASSNHSHVNREYRRLFGARPRPGRRPAAGRQLAEVPLEEPRDLVDGLVGLVQRSEVKLEDMRAFAGHL